ncbi:chemotaxis protein CheR, partial [Pseudoalteromonas sp. S409]
MNNQDLQQNEYDQFRSFLEQQCGIVLGENKQ